MPDLDLRRAAELLRDHSYDLDDDFAGDGAFLYTVAEWLESVADARMPGGREIFRVDEMYAISAARAYLGGESDA